MTSSNGLSYRITHGLVWTRAYDLGGFKGACAAAAHLDADDADAGGGLGIFACVVLLQVNVEFVVRGITSTHPAVVDFIST